MGDKGSRDELKGSVSGTEAAPAVARLCYVDDSRTSAYVIRKLLQPYGYQVDYFQSAEPAFVALIQEDYDLLLTDLKVSSKGMDGDDLIRTLRQSGHSKLSSLPVIVITGASDARVLVEVYDAGANQVMSKPVDAEVLNDHILRLLPDSKPDLRVVEQQRDRDNVVSLSAVQRSDQKQTQSEDDTNILTAPKFVSKKANVPKKDKSTVKAKSTVPKKAKATPPPKTKQSDSDIPLLDAESPDQSSAIQGNVEQANQENISKPKTARKPAKKTVENTVDIEKESLLERAVLKQDEQKIVKPDKKPARKSVKDNAVQKTVKPHADLENKKPEKVKVKSLDSVNVTTTSTGKSVEDKNILNDLDQHTLVVGDRPGSLSSSAILDLFTSLVELVGMRSLIQRIVAAGIVIFLVLMAWNILFDEGQPVKTAYVEAGEIFQSITVPGRVLSKQRVNISSEQTGRTVKILVKEGDRVKAGQVLAKMDDRELISRHNRAKANLADAKEGIVVAERTLTRLRKAFKKGAVARRFVKDAEVDLSTARSQAGIAVEEAHSANLALSKQRITAPFSGTITAKFAEVGQWVGPSESLFTLVDESRREIEVRVDAADSASIDVGQVVAVTSDAFPGLEWHESVSRLGAAANSDRNSNSVKVYVSLGNDAPTLRFGQQVDADIRTAWNPNTLKVPFEALINRDGKTLVAVLREGQVMLKQVEIGIEDFSVVEIKQGLTEGELVILSKGQFLQNGDKVHSVRGNI